LCFLLLKGLLSCLLLLRWRRYRYICLRGRNLRRLMHWSSAVLTELIFRI
jgi:hypothetical protein